MDNIIPTTMWVFYPMATNVELAQYATWCKETLQYVPYMDQNIIIFKSKEDTAFFRLSYSTLR